MMHSLWHTRFATAVAVLLALLVGAPLAQAQRTVDLDDLVFFSPRRVFGLTGTQRLVRFRLLFPQFEQDIGAVSGLQPPDSALVGIVYTPTGTVAHGATTATYSPEAGLEYLWVEGQEKTKVSPSKRASPLRNTIPCMRRQPDTSSRPSLRNGVL